MMLERKTYTELAEDVVIGFGRIRIATQGAFDDGETKGPYVRLHAVCATTRVGTSLGNTST